MRRRARLIVLVGPKGSGKTTLGRFLESEAGVHFLEVEASAKRALEEAGGVIDEHYAERAFAAMLDLDWAVEVDNDPPITRARLLELLGHLLKDPG